VLLNGHGRSLVRASLTDVVVCLHVGKRQLVGLGLSLSRLAAWLGDAHVVDLVGILLVVLRLDLLLLLLSSMLLVDLLRWPLVRTCLDPLSSQIPGMQVLVQLEPVTTLIDPVSALRLIQEVSGTLQHHDILTHVLFLAVFDVLVRRSVVP